MSDGQEESLGAIPGSCPTGRWRQVPGYERLYIVSSEGEVASMFFDPPRTVTSHADKDGYLRVRLNKNGRRRTHKVHRIVCEAFHGPANALHREVAHLDGKRDNCRAANLKWVSHAENASHKLAHGTHQTGEGHPRAILTNAAVERIRTRYATSREIAGEYGVSRHTVYDIWQGKKWRHA